VWNNDAFVKTRITEKQRRNISDDIIQIMESGVDKGDTYWIMRRIVIKKTEKC
jgi:hypothetical protein